MDVMDTVTDEVDDKTATPAVENTRQRPSCCSPASPPRWGGAAGGEDGVVELSGLVEFDEEVQVAAEMLVAMGNPVAKRAVSSAMVRSRSVTAPWMFGEASSSSRREDVTPLSEKPERFTTTSVSWRRTRCPWHDGDGSAGAVGVGLRLELRGVGSVGFAADTSSI